MIGLLAPIVAVLLILFFRKKEGWIALGGSFISLVSGMVLLIKGGFPVEISMNGLPGLPFVLRLDHLSVLLIQVVNLVSFFIFIYALGYMKDEKSTWFWPVMSLFLASMNLMVLAADWFLLLVGWELMGLSSYFLIAVWHWRKDAQEGAARAFMITRSTDLFLYIGIFAVIAAGNHPLIENQGKISLFAGFSFLVAVMGKSAQVPFQSWLSGAMAGPTPVSALLHSATMVAAGVVFLLKIYPLIPHEALVWIGSVGGVTILLTGLTAFFADDIKQMLAASTSSQLGFMLLAIGAGSPGAALAHLIAHAFMKSSLFLGSGIFQHAYESTSFEDLQGGGRRMKWTLSGFLIAGIALAGIPPFIGFWSKDGVLAAALHSEISGWYFPAALGGALLTAMYIGRSIGILWKGNKENPSRTFSIMLSGLAMLILFVAGGGFFLKDVIHFPEMKIPESSAAKYTGLVLSFAGLATGYFLKTPVYKRRIASYIRNNYEIKGGYRNILGRPVFIMARFIHKIEDKLYVLLMRTGKVFLQLSEYILHSENGLFHFANKTGKMNLQFGNLIEVFDIRVIGKSIGELIAGIKRAGERGRKLQSGLIHKELIISVIGFVVVVIILMVI